MSSALPMLRRIRGPAVARPTAWRVAAVGTAVTVALNIAYPLARPEGRSVLSVLTVLVFAATSLSGAWAFGGARTAAAVLLAGGGIGLLAEIAGVATGVPFGSYRYADTLGPKLLGVPLLVPLAWVMMSWPAWVVGSVVAGRVRRGRRLTALLAGAWAMASWDVFLDPQMVAAGHWRWLTGNGLAAPIPGVAGIPVSNLLGWTAVSLVVIGALQLVRIPAASPGSIPGPAATLFVWTWIGGIVANALFFGRPGVAAVGGVLMGLVAVPFFRSWLGSRR